VFEQARTPPHLVLDIQNGVLAGVLEADGDAALRAQARALAADLGTAHATRSLGLVIIGADGRVAWWAAAADGAELECRLAALDGTPLAGRPAGAPARPAAVGWPGAPVELRPGTDVVDPAGEKIGELFALHPEGEATTHLMVHTGWLFVKGYFVPVEAVAGIMDDEIVLSVAKDQVEAQGWDVVPD
jgi:hypothetical protein